MSAIFKRILNDKKQVNLTRITNLKEEKILKKKLLVCVSKTNFIPLLCKYKKIFLNKKEYISSDTHISFLHVVETLLI